MKEMGFYDAAKFFPQYSERDKILAYAVLGVSRITCASGTRSDLSAKISNAIS